MPTEYGLDMSLDVVLEVDDIEGLCSVLGVVHDGLHDTVLLFIDDVT